MRNKLRKIKRVGNRVSLFCMNLAVLLLISCPVYANGGTIGEPALVSGTRKLIAAGTGILTGIVAAVCIWKASTVGIQWINASAEEKPKFQKELITVIIAGVVTLTIGSTVTWIVGFYGA